MQARRVIGDQPGDTAAPTGSGLAAMPGSIVPRRLPSLGQPSALGSIPEAKGKGPSNGRPSVKKSPHASSDEDVSGAEGSKTKLTTPAPVFSPTRPLAPLGPLGINAPLPPISGGGIGGGAGARLPRIRRPTPSNLNLPTTMSPRRVAMDPFSEEPISPIRTSAPLSPIQTLPPRPAMGPIKPKQSPTKEK